MGGAQRQAVAARWRGGVRVYINNDIMGLDAHAV